MIQSPPSFFSPQRAMPEATATTSNNGRGLAKCAAWFSFMASMSVGAYFGASAVANSMRRPPVPTNRLLDIRECSYNDTLLIQNSHRRISQNIEEIVYKNLDSLTADNEDTLRTCFKNESESCAAYICNDDLNRCASPAVLGYYAGGNDIYLCMDNLKSIFSPDHLDCELDELIVHEVAHYIGVPSAANHNNGPNNDTVYRLGDSTNALCLEDSMNNHTRYLS